MPSILRNTSSIMCRMWKSEINVIDSRNQVTILKAFEIVKQGEISSIGVKLCLISSISFNFTVHQN